MYLRVKNVVLFATLTLASCESDQEGTVEKYCKYLRPGMSLAAANALIGWSAERKDGGRYYWANCQKCVVNLDGGNRIMEVVDFYRLRHYHKLLDSPGVFEQEIQTEDQAGFPINQWECDESGQIVIQD